MAEIRRCISYSQNTSRVRPSSVLILRPFYRCCSVLIDPQWPTTTPPAPCEPAATQANWHGLWPIWASLSTVAEGDLGLTIDYCGPNSGDALFISLGSGLWSFSPSCAARTLPLCVDVPPSFLLNFLLSSFGAAPLREVGSS